MSKKQDTIDILFAECQRKNDYIFTNKDVKSACEKTGFSNPYDVTKIDQSNKLPACLSEKDYFIAHLGKGRHQFVRGINIGYHQFEPVQAHTDKSYKKSLLNEVDKSESNILSLCSNQQILNDFLYEDEVAAPKSYGARRTKCDLHYHIGNTPLTLDKMQMEIDLTMEINHIVTVFEAKNGFHNDFAVYQLFHPFLYYHYLKAEQGIDIKEINCCYLLRNKKKLRLYLYTFSDLAHISSIKLIKSKEYNLVER